jgi:phospholipid/cholesterol/gamma-HCH transport system substrate-binding protein
MGIIGEKYVTITPGSSDIYIKNGGVIRETEPPLDIESLISKFVFGSMDNKKDGETNKGGE